MSSRKRRSRRRWAQRVRRGVRPPSDRAADPARRSPVDRAADPARRWLWAIRRAIGRAEVAQLQRFGRSALSTVFRTPALVLVSTGRRSRQRRATPVAFHRLPDGDLLVVGGAGGQRRTPDWIANIRADPQVEVVVDGRRVPMWAEELVGDERAEAWADVSRVWPRVVRYQMRAGRPIPVLRLHLRPPRPGEA